MRLEEIQQIRADMHTYTLDTCRSMLRKALDEIDWLRDALELNRLLALRYKEVADELQKENKRLRQELSSARRTLADYAYEYNIC